MCISFIEAVKSTLENAEDNWGEHTRLVNIIDSQIAGKFP